jgi:hypothetical protein
VRSSARLIEFFGLAAVAVALALGVWTTAQQAFAAPMAKVEAALAAQS